MSDEISVDAAKNGTAPLAEVTRRRFSALSLAVGAVVALPTIVAATEVNGAEAAPKRSEKPKVAPRFPR